MRGYADTNLAIIAAAPQANIYQEGFISWMGSQIALGFVKVVPEEVFKGRRRDAIATGRDPVCGFDFYRVGTIGKGISLINEQFIEPSFHQPNGLVQRNPIAR
jgi:hypothetical protein